MRSQRQDAGNQDAKGIACRLRDQRQRRLREAAPRALEPRDDAGDV
jgi:hypothetical protein